MMRLEISGDGSQGTELAGVADTEATSTLRPVPLCTSRPGQAAAAQGETVVPSAQGAALQGHAQVPYAGEGAAPALQHEAPGLPFDGELAEAQVPHTTAAGRGLGGQKGQ